MRATMPKTPARTTRKVRTAQRIVDRSRSGKRTVGATRARKAAASGTARRRSEGHPCVIKDGRATYVLVPVDEYERMVEAEMVQHAIAQIERGDDDFVDADDFFLELAAERIAEARKAKGLTQKQLGKKLNLPQSQISRIERNPDRTTVRTLKRIARALGVDVGSLI